MTQVNKKIQILKALSFVVSSKYCLAQQKETSSSSSFQKVEKNPQTPFLKEIMLGRCYLMTSNDNTKSNPGYCWSLVDSMLDVFQGRKDKDVLTADFYSYYNIADFTVGKDNTGLFWLGGTFATDNGGGALTSATTVSSYSHLVRPQDTPGGSLLDGLVFCGSDSVDDCPRFLMDLHKEEHSETQHDEGWQRRLDSEQEQQAQQAAQQQQQQAQQEQEQQAQQQNKEVIPFQDEQNSDTHVERSEKIAWNKGSQTSFWAGVYQKFASNLSGLVTVVMVVDENGLLMNGDNDDESMLFVHSAVPNFDLQKVSEIDIHLVAPSSSLVRSEKDKTELSCSNAKAVSDLKDVLHANGLKSVTCVEDPSLVRLLMCSHIKDMSDACRSITSCLGNSSITAETKDTAATTSSAADKVEGSTIAEASNDAGKHHTSIIGAIALTIVFAAGIFVFARVLNIRSLYDSIEEVLPLKQ